ncbi:hypothetical protein ACVW07_001660 [Cellulomonas sp. URHB0016]
MKRPAVTRVYVVLSSIAVTAAAVYAFSAPFPMTN